MPNPTHEFWFLNQRYVMEEASWEQDVAYQQEFTPPNSDKPDARRLWRRRISVALVEPRMNEQELAVKNFKFMTAMITKWADINGVDPGSFLLREKSAKPSTSTMPADTSTSSQTSSEDLQSRSASS